VSAMASPHQKRATDTNAALPRSLPTSSPPPASSHFFSSIIIIVLHPPSPFLPFSLSLGNTNNRVKAMDSDKDGAPLGEEGVEDFSKGPLSVLWHSVKVSRRGEGGREGGTEGGRV